MVKQFTCGHKATVQPYKDARKVVVAFPCAACRYKEAVNISASTTETVSLGTRTVRLSLKVGKRA